MEFGGDAVTQAGTAPAPHAIGLAIRAVQTPLRRAVEFNELRGSFGGRERACGKRLLEADLRRRGSACGQPAATPGGDLV
jgi:hypothetical protein